MSATVPDRTADRLAWTRQVLENPDATLAVASSDASFRSYWRTINDGRSLIVMDAPPPQEDVRPWLDIAARLRQGGLNAPRVHARDVERGFLLIDDLGTRLYLPELDDNNADTLYGDAMDALLRMQATVDVTGLPVYDEPFLVSEMELLPEWFLGRHLDRAPDCDQWDVLEVAFRVLLDNARLQPHCFVHRDFHSRNLLVTDADNPGIIDFQGAMLGPIAYDLASLLRDCYIAWDDARVAAWVEGFRIRLQTAQLIGHDVDTRRFRRWFDLIGMQRHIKVLGLFCRLAYRDGKPDYLADLPRVLDYVLRVAGRYRELTEFATLLQSAIGDRDVSRTAACER